MPTLTCGCPITKTLTVNFTGSDPAPANGYILKWQTASGSLNTVTPNPTSSPVTISNVPVCEDITVTMQSQCDNSEVSAIQTTTVSAQTGYTCSQTIETTHTHLGYYSYTPFLLDVRGATSTINLNYNVGETSSNKPNKFTVYDSLGNAVATTDWKGVASYSGPWGSSLSTSTTGILTFTKTDCFYKLVVESYTDVSFQDKFSVVVNCPTSPSTVIPTITYVSCSGGYGAYRIDAPSGTNMKVKLTASGSLTNNSTSGYCAQLQGVITSSTGPTDTEQSGIVSTSGSASIGSSNTLYVDVTVPGSGYLVINTQVLTINSSSSYTTASINIFEVNGSASNVSQSICVYNSTGVVSCGAPTYQNYYATKYECSGCTAVSGVGAALVALPIATAATLNDYYVPGSASGEQGNFIYKLISTTSSGPGVILDNLHASTCSAACALALP